MLKDETSSDVDEIKQNEDRKTPAAGSHAGQKVCFLTRVRFRIAVQRFDWDTLDRTSRYWIGDSVQVSMFLSGEME